MQVNMPDSELLSKFQTELKARVPHFEEGVRRELQNPTPLKDITGVVMECAREIGMDVSSEGLRVFGKFDSEIFGGSVKMRPAAGIIEEAITSGKLRSGQTVFEATSGNFGLALGSLRKLGLDVVVLVSRKLQQGVIERLRGDGLKIVNLDVDICPAPGMQMSADALLAKSVASSVRQQLAEMGYDPAPFDRVRAEAEVLLGRQDAINLAKLLAETYGGFCPEQYDNDQNLRAHFEVTGPELEEQLRTVGMKISDFQVVCAFGTGGTATGLSRYLRNGSESKSVRVVFPLPSQDVAGIRTREKAQGLKFYEPEAYAGEHEVDFEEARKVFSFFNSRGYDMGESGALALYACIQMIKRGAGGKFVVMIADGASKYPDSGVLTVERKDEVTLQEARADIGGYSAVVWTHNMFVPRERGISAIASSLGCEESAVKIASARDVQQFLTTGELPVRLSEVIPVRPKRILLVCMMGGTSLIMARRLAKLGVDAASLTGGIASIPAERTSPPSELVKVEGV